MNKEKKRERKERREKNRRNKEETVNYKSIDISNASSCTWQSVKYYSSTRKASASLSNRIDFSSVFEVSATFQRNRPLPNPDLPLIRSDSPVRYISDSFPCLAISSRMELPGLSWDRCSTSLIPRKRRMPFTSELPG